MHIIRDFIVGMENEQSDESTNQGLEGVNDAEAELNAALYYAQDAAGTDYTADEMDADIVANMLEANMTKDRPVVDFQ